MNRKFERYFTLLSKLKKRGIHLLSLTILVPLLLAPSDSWDGTLFDNAELTRSLSGMRHSFVGQGWWIQNYLMEFLIRLSWVTHVDLFSLHKILFMLCLIAIIYEINLVIQKNVSNESAKKTIYACFYINPAWSMYLSSVMLAHIFYIYLALFSVRRIGNTRKCVSVYLVTLIVSLELNSNLVFIPVYFFLSNFLSDRKIWKEKLFLIKQSIVVIIIFVYFLIHNVAYRPSGEFKNYNSVTLRVSYESISNLVRDSLHFSTFLTLPMLVVFLLITPRVNGSLISIKEVTFRIFLGSILLSSAIIPYLAVGKSTNILQLDWNIRQSQLMLFSIPISLSWILALIPRDNSHRNGKSKVLFFGMKIILAIAFLGMLLIQGRSSISYLDTSYREKNAILNLKDQAIRDCYKVYLIQENPWRIGIRDYESNFIAHSLGLTSINVEFKKFGVTDTQLKLENREEIRLPNIIRQSKNEFLGAESRNLCRATVLSDNSVVDFSKIE